ncbi:Rieske (2Fe-2S) protein [Botrimarina hoheduenensis]|uniref:Assimilatory nitrite reductase [NAD(P)H] small subunit n=1 Tax=Botrimarina hoheduenensis TaxID=2528000 RepID=A0A5C5VVB4_9BACT|nr:Rieske (2Fe-2S) protein [Botrimarina hoheduenensis]TWT41609.1 Assimilatory nitrite reductase [NAD(P)H] small subunit [Botrimarina hoheduenensis]
MSEPQPSVPAGEDEFITVAKLGDLAEGEGRTVEVGNRLVALFLHQGQHLAIDDFCPHQGASLGAGCLDEEGAVACPWHGWRFRMTDGTWCDNPRIGVDRFAVRIAGDEVQVSRQPIPPSDESPGPA